MPYTYAWDNGETTATATTLSGGTHSVTVTDANGCVSIASGISIDEPALLTSSASQDTGVSCEGVLDGQATVTVTGGTMPYTYAWDNGETTATATALSGGLHSVTVTDANGCISIASGISIDEPTL